MADKFVVYVSAPPPGEAEAAAQKLAELLKLDPRKVEALMRRLPDVVTRPVSEREADVAANNATQRRRAQRAYLRLNRDALRLVEPGGLLVTASCTAQVAPEQFREVVAEASRAAGVRVQIVADQGHALDHPVPLSFPEGRYLKFLVLRVL